MNLEGVVKVVIVKKENLKYCIDERFVQDLMDNWGTDNEDGIIIEDYENGINFIINEKGYMHFAEYINLHNLIKNIEVVWGGEKDESKKS